MTVVDKAYRDRGCRRSETAISVDQYPVSGLPELVPPAVCVDVEQGEFRFETGGEFGERCRQLADAVGDRCKCSGPARCDRSIRSSIRSCVKPVNPRC